MSELKKRGSEAATTEPNKAQKVNGQPKVVIPGYEAIGPGVIRNEDGSLNFESTVKRISELIPRYIKRTPQYYYELLSQNVKCNLQLKLENMQSFGDIYSRNCLSIILGNIFNQKERIKHELAEVTGLVVVLDPAQSTKQVMIDGVVLIAIHMKLKVTIYVAPGAMSLLQVAALHAMHTSGAKVIFHKGDSPSCHARALKHAHDMNMVVLDLNFASQFAMVGAATVANEMLDANPNLETIVIPLRLYSVGWSYVAGISLFAKMRNPNIRVIVVQMSEDLARLESPVEDDKRQSLFPDRLEVGWLSLVQERQGIRNMFDTFDSQNLGFISQMDLEKVIVNMGGDPKRFLPPQIPKLSLTEFITRINAERFKVTETAFHEDQSFMSYLCLENLKKQKVVDELVEVTEDQSAVAFIQCLEYTHTLTNGKGSIALAGLWSGKIQVRPEEKVVVLIMGGFVDVIDFQTIFDYGLDLIGQNFDLELDIPDNTSSLSKVLHIIGEHKISVYEVNMNRSAQSLRQYHVRILIQCRSRNFEQQKQVMDALHNKGIICTNKSRISTSAPPTDVVLVEPHPSLVNAPPTTAATTTTAAATKTTSPATTASTTTTPASTTASSTGSIFGTLKNSDQLYPKPSRMEDVTPETIREAHERVRGNLNQTPIYHSQMYSKLCKCKTYLFLENIQKTGSFKIRGSTNMVLKALEQSPTRPKGLVAASAGNHAQGVAIVSSKVGLPCTIVCPEYAPESKLQWTRSYGAEVIKKGNSLEETAKFAENLCDQRGWLMVRPFNDVDVIEGQATMGCEIYDRIPDIDTVLVNVGGGGMIAGIATYLKGVNPNIRIVGVQSQNVAPLAEFKTTHLLRYIEPQTLTIADGTNVKQPGGVHTKILAELVDEYVTVSENEIASTIVHLMENSRTLSEGAGCLGLAALLHHKIAVRKDEKVCVVICGGNIDMSTLKQVYEYGLRSLGRCFTVHLTTFDYPGHLASIMSYAARAELITREIRHIRAKGDINWNECTISLSFYSNSFEHQNYFLNLLVEQSLFPKVVGRKYIKDHATIYASFDEACEKRKVDLSKTYKERQEQFINWCKQQYSTVF